MVAPCLLGIHANASFVHLRQTRSANVILELRLFSRPAKVCHSPLSAAAPLLIRILARRTRYYLSLWAVFAAHSVAFPTFSLAFWACQLSVLCFQFSLSSHCRCRVGSLRCCVPSSRVGLGLQSSSCAVAFAVFADVFSSVVVPTSSVAYPAFDVCVSRCWCRVFVRFFG